MVDRLVFLGALAGATLFFLLAVMVARGHHTGVPCGPASDPGRAVCLPYADSSFAVRTLQQTKKLTYCFDQRAASYPNFINQVRQVNADQEAMWGFDWVEIAGTYQTSAVAGAAGCEVWHSMPATHGCGGCGAWVHYLNKPVIIEYRWQAGYALWQTTISHEQTHILGLHEHYDDANFLSHRNTYGVWAHGYDPNRNPGTGSDSPTVMDFGTGQWQATEYDRRYVCENMDPNGQFFRGCGFVAAPPGPWGECDTRYGNCWLNRPAWVFPDGSVYDVETGKHYPLPSRQ